MKVNIWASIIIPTVLDQPPNLKYFPQNLNDYGIELILQKDLGWKNPAKTRNLGALKSKGDVLVFIDDDVKLDFNSLICLMKKVKENDKQAFIFHPPHLLIVNRRLFFTSEGYDERYAPRFFEDVEIGYKLRKIGALVQRIDPLVLNLKELRPTTAASKGIKYVQLIRRSIWLHTEYNLIDFRRHIIRKHPVLMFLNLLWWLEWSFFRRRLPRSIFCTKI